MPSEILEVQILLGEVFVVRLFRFGRLVEDIVDGRTYRLHTDRLFDVNQEADILNKPNEVPMPIRSHAGPHRLAA